MNSAVGLPEALLQPGNGDLPLALDGRRRQIKQLGRFLDGHTRKGAGLKKLHVKRIYRFELLEHFIKLYDVADSHIAAEVLTGKARLQTVVPFLRPQPPTFINQNLAHDAARKAKKMLAPVEINAVDVDEPEVSLINQRRRLQIGVSLVAQVSGRIAPQLVVKRRNHNAPILGASIRPVLKNLCDVTHRGLVAVSGTALGQDLFSALECRRTIGETTAQLFDESSS